MQQRLISAAVLVPVVVIAFLLGQPWLTVFIAALAAGAAWETSRLVRLAGLDADTWLAIFMSVLSVVALWWLLTHPTISRTAIAGIGFVGFVVIASALFALRREPVTGFKTWAGTMVATFYPSLLAFLAGVTLVTAPPRAGTRLFDLDAGRAWLIVLVLTVWSLDSFAYLSGKFIGKGRFMNHISPNKTWSGAIGGGIAAVIVCSALTVIVAGEKLEYGLFLGVLIAIVAQAGDLTESMLKRAAGVKDSGNLLPGHGGFLDRLDSFLFAAPVMFAVLMLLSYFQPYVLSL